MYGLFKTHHKTHDLSKEVETLKEEVKTLKEQRASDKLDFTKAIHLLNVTTSKLETTNTHLIEAINEMKEELRNSKP